MSYETLIAEHGRIDMALGHLQRLIDADAPDTIAVTLALSDLSAELSHHLAHEDSFIYPRMIATGNTGISATAQEFVEDFAQLRADWGVYLTEWTAECIEADWLSFKFDTCRMIVRLAERVRAENELLYVAALQAGAIRLRKAA